MAGAGLAMLLVAATPAEVVRINPQGGREALSAFNTERIAGVDMR